MDIATILLASQQQRLWLYYAFMATAGSILGGFVTYRIARKGGKEALEKKFSGRTLDNVYKRFERRGFLAIAIPALLPPPVPLTPFLFVAGALQYPAWKFVAALTAGRSVRYSLIAYLAGRYGSELIGLIKRFAHLGIVGGVLAVAVIAAAAFFFFKKYKLGKRPAHQK
jgi:membrane protein YqaA with SNARE-associated domain